jgi:sugar phosphate isomerase/epimerase
MLKAFSTLGCPEFSLEQALALAQRHGIPAIEVRTLEGQLDLPAYFAAHFGTPEALAAKVRAQPVRIVALDTSLRLADGSPADGAAFLRFLPWAEALGVRWLRVFDGGGSEAIAAAARGFAWWREQRRAAGWRADLMVETHDSLFSAEAIAAFLRAAPDAHLLWDAHNTWTHGARDVVALWRAIRAAVVHVHVKDSVDRPVLSFPHTYVLPGQGGFPMPALLAALRADGFAGPLSLEWERQWHPYLPPLEEALTEAARTGWW